MNGPGERANRLRSGFHPPGLAQRFRSWLIQHLQCAVASAGTLWRAPWGTLLTSGVIGVALALPLGLYLIVDGISNVSARFGTGFEISAFLRMEMDETRAAELAQWFRGLPEVDDVRMIGREQALAELRAAAEVGAGAEMFAGSNPLPVVLVLKPTSGDTAAVDQLLDTVVARPEVDAVQADRAWLERLRVLLDLGHRVLWLLAGLLGVGVMLVVGNTLRLTVEARRTEVEIAKLFGAGDGFVRRPFLYQGLLYGASGGLVGCLLVVAGSLLLAEPVARLGAEYAATIRVPVPRLGHLASLLGGGAGLGLLGAWASVGRHLRAVQPR